MDWVAQIIGIFAFLSFIGSMGTDTKERYYQLYSISAFIFALHYFLMGEIVITIISVFAGIRTGCFAIPFGFTHRFKIGIACMIAAVASSLYIDQSLWTFLFCISLCLTVFSEISGNLLFIRLNHVSQRILYLVFYILIGSIGGILSEVCCLINLGRKLLENKIKPHAIKLKLPKSQIS